MNLPELLHRLVDLAPWREESHQVEAHQAIVDELEQPETGKHEPPAEDNRKSGKS